MVLVNDRPQPVAIRGTGHQSGHCRMSRIKKHLPLVGPQERGILGQREPIVLMVAIHHVQRRSLRIGRGPLYCRIGWRWHHHLPVQWPKQIPIGWCFPNCHSPILRLYRTWRYIPSNQPNKKSVREQDDPANDPHYI